MPSAVYSFLLHVKMAFQRHISPLFSPRPHILGVGRNGTYNIFTAFTKLSPQLFTIAKSNADQIFENQTDNQETHSDDVDHIDEQEDFTDTLEDSTSPGPSTEQTLREENNENPKLSTGTNVNPSGHNDTANKCTKKVIYPTHVTDRDRDGNERLLSYSFNKTTLRIFDIFHSLKIPYEIELYKPKEERLCVDPSVFYCKNIFIKDRRGQIYLVICHEETDMDLKHLRKELKAHRNFNFVNGEEMKFLLGTDPGGVTPLALMYANALHISMVISKTLYKEGAALMFHPLDCTLATKLSMQSLLRYLKYVGHTVTIVD